MEYGEKLNKFLDRIRKKRAGVYTLNGAYLLFTVLIGGYLIGNTVSYFTAQARSFVLTFFFLCAAPLAYVFYHYLIRGLKFSRDQAALLVEAKHPDLNNSLINSWQLQRYLGDSEADRSMSLAFIHELVRETCARIEGIPADSIFDRTEIARNRNLFWSAAGLLTILSLTLPDFLPRGYSNLISLPKTATIPTHAKVEGAPASPATPLPVYTIGNMTLTFNYPAYTQLKSNVIHNADGKIHALPGTEVRLQAKTDHPVDGANLVLNDNDSLAMSVTGEKNDLNVHFLIKEQGTYKFQVKSPEGQAVLLPKEYPITVARDNPPRIILFVSNPKPVYHTDDQIRLTYETLDDYGIQKIDLISEVNGKTERTTIKTLKTTTRDLKDSYTWSLSGFESGDQVKYYLEVQDNDNVSGPNTGHSEIFSFSIYDTRDEQENLIRLQDELTEKLVTLLAQSLIGNADLNKFSTLLLKKFIVSNADQVMNIIGLAQNIQAQAKNLPGFPESYITLLKNITVRLVQIRGEQIDLLNKISMSIAQNTPTGFDFPPAKSVTEKLITEVEQDILFIIKIANRQKMEQVANLKDDLNNLAASLQKEFNKAKDGKTQPNLARLQAQIEKMKQALKKMMDQFSRQTQPSADEFLNPNAFKSLDLEQMSAALDKIMKLASQQKIDEALKEMEKLSDSLQTLAKQIDKADADKEALLDKEIMKKIDESLRDILDLEKKQTDLLERTAKINESLKTAQSRNSEDNLKKFFDELGNLVSEIQSILRENSEFLREHPLMNKLNELLELETKTSKKVQDQAQKTLDSHLTGESDSRFKSLHEIRGRLAEIEAEKEALRVGAIQRFQEALPKVSDSYKTLKEQTELLDFAEFNKQFKNIYPEIFRLQGNLQMTSNVREDLAERVNDDLKKVSRLNSEISKKLGSMVRTLERDFQSLLSKQNKEEMEQMAKQESQMQKETENMAQQFAKMNQQNPMITPDLNTKMTDAGRHIQSSENHLKQHNIPKSLESENNALENLIETENILRELKNSGDTKGQKSQQETIKLGTGRAQDKKQGGGIRTQSEKVELPSQDQFQAPGEFREEILKAMKGKYPQKYEHFITEYYKELVK